jgi:hypothetical protein
MHTSTDRRRIAVLVIALVSLRTGSSLAGQQVTRFRSRVIHEIHEPTHISFESPMMPPASTPEDQPESANEADQQPATSFEELKLRVTVGEAVYVVDKSGQETRGRIASLSQVALTLAVDGTRRDFVADAIGRIDRRRRDSVWNGVLIGAGAGALMGFAVGRTADSPDCPRSGIECGQGAVIGTVSGALWGAVGGWITDMLMRKRETVYSFRGPPE